MSDRERFYSVEQVAERLGLHVRTVRNYVRDGRLPAVRIGKQYRIAREDLETFTGRPMSAPEEGAERPARHTEASSIVEVEGVDARTADRLSTLLTSAAAARGFGERPLRVQTVYDPDRARMKVIVLGGLADTARLFDYIEGVLAS
ncbi:helix-turn-helix domain-containing protein [Streptomyces sp. RS10V-4]|uniref:helix-turn-helix domain-containing protein n=1 Tax=Streptomyces rhizoryzae TaxID=2932493 RepID=UPI002003A8C1|nr:helix-turn-helix domain-containing protein [Streptomyces rhizoryzae]MCK7626589.1 helix-turn-helix domain-containing protein [Streptomyces rhizoryzae]